MARALVRNFFSNVDLIARKHDKLVLGLSFILRIHAGDFLLSKYREIFTKIRRVDMFSIWIRD